MPRRHRQGRRVQQARVDYESIVSSRRLTELLGVKPVYDPSYEIRFRGSFWSPTPRPTTNPSPSSRPSTRPALSPRVARWVQSCPTPGPANQDLAWDTTHNFRRIEQLSPITYGPWQLHPVEDSSPRYPWIPPLDILDNDPRQEVYLERRTTILYTYY